MMTQVDSALSKSGAAIIFQQSEITEASLEVIQNLTEPHRAAIFRAYQEDFQFKVKVDAAVTYLAVRIAMAANVEDDTENYIQVALTPEPWFVNDFDVRIIVNALIDASKSETENLFVSAKEYRARLDALSAIFKA